MMQLHRYGSVKPPYQADKKKWKSHGLRFSAPIAAAIMATCAASPVHAQQLFALRGHGTVHRNVFRSTALGRLSPNARMDLAISLPVRNQMALDNALLNIYNPDSADYHKYYTAKQFSDAFGPSEADYNAVVAFLVSRGFTVNQTHPNRMLVDVRGSIASIEQTFHVQMLNYRHPTENRTFFGPDREPSVDQAVPILDITGLDNFELPRPKNLHVQATNQRSHVSGVVSSATGSGPGGTYRGIDFRSAYAPQVTLDGAGQNIGLFQFGSYYPADIANYCAQSGIPNAQITQVLLNGVSGSPNPGDDTLEQSLDIDMAHAMAPAARIYFYTGNNAADIWNRMATDNICKQISSSWSVSPPPSTLNQILQQMAAQGQSVFNASGDSGYSSSPFGWDDSPYMTSVGGTELTTSGPDGYRTSETGWSGSSGYISPNFGIPTWQQGINMTACGGSTTQRNCPDVAMVADQIWEIWSNGTSGTVLGTSAASPLWAGYMALVNQQAVAHSKPTAGFINPAVYAIGKGGSYSANFVDITSGNNGKPAVAGYDLVTGWGSPTGQTFINSLAGCTGDAPFFMIVNKYSGKCLDLIGGDRTNGARINQWTYDYNGPNQRWAILPTPQGNHFKLISWVSGKAASIANNSLTNGAQLWDWDFTGDDPGQEFDLIDVGNGYFKIKNVRSGLILDDDAFGTGNDNKIQQWTDGNTDNQIWRLQPWGNYMIRAASGRYVCIANMGSTNGSSIIQYDQQNNPWFKWMFTSEGSGWYGLFSLNAPGRVLCVANGSSTAGWNCHLWDYNPNNAGDQKIRIMPKTDGKFKFYFAHDGMSWDIPGGQTANNVPLQQYPDNGNNWQEFSLERTP